jgi:CheY-like chemotaxis protein
MTDSDSDDIGPDVGADSATDGAPVARTDGGSAPGTEKEPVEILLAEDNPNDVDLTRMAFEEGKIVNNLHVVTDGVEALAYLNQEGEYADAPRPDIVLLDLEMPRKGGKEVLEEMDDDPSLRRIPVVVLTSSEAEEDVVESYEHNANAYLTKPVGFQEFQEIVRQIESFWFEVVKLPPDE